MLYNITFAIFIGSLVGIAVILVSLAEKYLLYRMVRSHYRENKACVICEMNEKYSRHLDEKDHRIPCWKDGEPQAPWWD